MPGLQELRADAGVEAHAASDLVDVGADALADVGDLVDERDLGRQEGVGGELDHLRRGDVGAHDLAAERLVGGGDRVGGRLRAGVGADDDPVGLEEVLDRGALLEELGAGDVDEVGLRAADRRTGPGGHGALHHQRVLGARGERGDHGFDPREVGVAGVGRRRVDAAEEQLRRFENGRHLGGEGEPLAVFLHQLRQAGLVDRQRRSGAQRLDLVGVDVDRDHRVADLGEAGRGHEADPADSDYADRRLLARVHVAREATSLRTRASRSRSRASGPPRATAAGCCSPSRRPCWSSSRPGGDGRRRRRAGSPAVDRPRLARVARGSARRPSRCRRRRSTRR